MTYEDLKFKLDHDEIVVFDEDKSYIAIGSAGVDSDGNYRDSGRWSSIEKCLENIGSYSGDTEEELKENLLNWKYIESYPPKYTPVPKGTKVLILDCAKEECKKFGLDWNDEKLKMVGKECEIKGNCGNNYAIYNEDKSDYWCFQRTAFTIAKEDYIKIGEYNGYLYNKKVIK